MSKDITLLREIYLGDAPELKVSTKVFFENIFSKLLHSPYTVNKGRKRRKIDGTKRTEGNMYFSECLTTEFVKFLDEFFD